MLARSVLAFLFLALCSVVAALPPACLLEVVSANGHPGDFDTLCGSGSDGVQKEIAQKCGSNTKEALQSYKQSCGEAGFKITLIHANTTSSSSPSQTSSISGSGSMTTGSGTAPTSGSGSRPSSGSGSKPSSGMGSSPTSTSPPYTESNVGSLQKADSVFIALVFAIVGALAM